MDCFTTIINVLPYSYQSFQKVSYTEYKQNQLLRYTRNDYSCHHEECNNDGSMRCLFMYDRYGLLRYTRNDEYSDPCIRKVCNILFAHNDEYYTTRPHTVCIVRYSIIVMIKGHALAGSRSKSSSPQYDGYE